MDIKRRIFGRLAGVVAGFGALSLMWSSRAETSPRAPVKPWDSTEFGFDVDGRNFPGIAIRLPDAAGAAGALFTACRICTHQACVFGYEADYQLVGDIVGQKLANPVLFCRCHLSVYDPMQQGRVLFGPAPRPPWLFDAHEDNGALIVSSLEKGAGEIG